MTDSSCGGTPTLLINASVRVFACERCNDPFPERCGCRKRPCERCGQLVFFAGDIPQQHLCLPPQSRSVTPAILFQQFQRAAIDQFAAHFVEEGRRLERDSHTQEKGEVA